MNKFLKSWQLIALMSVLLFASACEKDDPSPSPTPQKGRDILISTIVVNPDGMSGSAYMQLIPNIEKADYDNKTALEASYYVPTPVKGNYAFSLPGMSNKSSKLDVFMLDNGQLVPKGSVQLPANSGACGIALTGNKAYVSYLLLGKIAIIDLAKMNITKEIDITQYGIGDKNPDPTQMLIRDGILYVGLNQILKNNVPNPTRPKVDILLIDTKTDKPIKMITEETSGMSMPTKFEADHKGIFVDENNDIYVNCLAGWGFIGHKAGFLRIKSGETEFDKSYQFDVTTTKIEGEEHNADYCPMVQYAGNGKLYGTLSIPFYYTKPQPNWLKDRAIIPVEMDLKAKTIKRIGTHRSNNFATTVGLYKGKIIFGLATDTDKGFFVYNPSTGKISDKAIITVKGFPQSFSHFGEKW